MNAPGVGVAEAARRGTGVMNEFCGPRKVIHKNAAPPPLAPPRPRPQVSLSLGDRA